MNTTVRALHHSEPLQRLGFTFITHKPGVGTLLLAIVVLLSGLAVIYLTDINRRLAIYVEDGTNIQNQLHLEWGKLLLEQSTWSAQARIQTIAVGQLGMQTPTTNQTVMVKGNK